jgi:hypothetical protein
MNTDQDKEIRPDHDPLTEVVIGLVLKVASRLGSGFPAAVHTVQRLCHLGATGPSTCLLINFGWPRPQIQRIFR